MGTMNVFLFATSLVLMVVSGINLFWPDTPAPAKPIPAITTASEVSDLISRLKPLTKEPSSSYRGVRIVFSGAGVEIDLTTKDGNEYHGKAATLKDAVARITDPSSTIREVLQGWGN